MIKQNAKLTPTISYSHKLVTSNASNIYEKIQDKSAI